MGSMLDKPKTEWVDPEKGSSNGLEFGASSIQGWRTEMEDQHTIVDDIPGLPGHSLFAVYDGHGGKNAAIFAAKHILNVLQETEGFAAYSADQTSVASLETALKQCFAIIDSRMRADFDPRVYLNEMSGCTAIAVIVTPTHLVTANAGDSRALLCRGGLNVEISWDHKPTNVDERFRIERAGGCVSMKRVDGELAVSRALGDFQYKDPNIFATRPQDCKVSGVPDTNVQVRDMAEDQFIVLACDGIWDVMSNDAVIARITGYMSVEGESDPLLLAEELIEDALAKNSRDNMTACVVLFPASAALIARGKSGVAGLRRRRQAQNADEE